MPGMPSQMTPNASNLSACNPGSGRSFQNENGMTEQGWLPFVAETGTGTFDSANLSVILFGLFIVAFLVFEPYGLYGLWLRARNYWKGWPFSY